MKCCFIRCWNCHFENSMMKDVVFGATFEIHTFSPIGHDLGQRVRIIQKRNRWVDLKILSWKVSFCGFKESQERILQLDHFCSHWSIKLPMKFFAPIMRYNKVFKILFLLKVFSVSSMIIPSPFIKANVNAINGGLLEQ